MRAVFTIVSLVIVLAIMGLVAKKQLTSGVAPVPGVPGATAPTGTPQQQVQQFQQAVQGAMQQEQNRPVPDDK